MSSSSFEHTTENPAAMWFGNTMQWFDEEADYYGSWGGAFSHYFFERLDNGYNNLQAYGYANSSTYTYAYTYFEDQYSNPLIQVSQSENHLTTTWFG